MEGTDFKFSVIRDTVNGGDNILKHSIDDWIDYYNNDRYQWDLAKLSPNEYYDYLATGVYPILI